MDILNVDQHGLSEGWPAQRGPAPPLDDLVPQSTWPCGALCQGLYNNGHRRAVVSGSNAVLWELMVSSCSV